VQQIELGIEIRSRIAPFFPTELMKVIERVDARRGDIPVDGEITGCVEERIRIAPLVEAEGVEVVERIHTGVEHVGIVREVEERVEQRIALVNQIDRTVGDRRCSIPVSVSAPSGPDTKILPPRPCSVRSCSV